MSVGIRKSIAAVSVDLCFDGRPLVPLFKRGHVVALVLIW